MKTIKDLEPREIWKYFDILNQIPRPSKKEEQVIAYLLKFGKEHQLDTIKDDAGNVIIKKKASKGFEKLSTVILQGHVDMVCEKNSATIHDFEKDPIQTIVDGDWLKAKGTTLGADNGMGIAAMLAILASDSIPHGPLECLFTVDEETGLTGAHALLPNILTCSTLINLDTEEEGEIYMGCAGGRTTIGTLSYKQVAAPINYYWFKVSVSGLRGGHSGADIHLELGNANKILNRYLWKAHKLFGLMVAEVNGGNLHNAIAREAYAVAGVPSNKKEDIIILLNILSNDIKEELKHTDPKVNIKIETFDHPSSVIDNISFEKLLNLIYVCPHGVLNMSKEVNGLVQSSSNLAAIKMEKDGKIVIKTSQRSSCESQREDIVNQMIALFELSGAKVDVSDGYPGWQPNLNSPILKTAQEVYLKMFGKAPEVKAIHAGLECGLFLEKYPNLDMISCGPTIREAHSPDEKINIPSVEKWWKYLLELLQNIDKIEK